jgi:hypothetical protein
MEGNAIEWYMPAPKAKTEVSAIGGVAINEV